MRVPNCENAVVEPRKLTEYLLSRSHPVGAAKARFFVALGYAARNGERLVADLLAILENDVAETKETRFGVKYVVVGQILTPNGSRATVATVWIIESGQSVPRLVTAYPG